MPVTGDRAPVSLPRAAKLAEAIWSPFRLLAKGRQKFEIILSPKECSDAVIAHSEQNLRRLVVKTVDD
jgi:hypothetical protein